MALEIIAVRDEPRCRLCPRRADFDPYLALYANSQPDPVTGKPLTWNRLSQLAHTFVGEPVSIRACRRHFDGHCRLAGEQEKAEVEELVDEQTALVATFLERVKSGEKADPDDALDFVIALGISELEARLKREGKSGVSVDQMLKAVEAKTRRKTDESRQALLGALTGGLTQVFQSQPFFAGEVEAEKVGEIEPGEVVGEVIAEEDKAA